MKLHKKILYITGLTLLVTGTNLFAAQPSAKEIVNKAYQYLGSIDQYTFNAIVSDDVLKDAEIVDTQRQEVSVKIDRPNKLRVDIKSDIKNRTSYINNGLFTMLDHNFGYYGQLETPKSIDDTLDLIFDKYGIKAPLASLIYSDMHKRTKFNRSKYFGTMDVAGVECDYVAFKSRIREVHIWITTGENPLVKAYSIIDTNSKENTRRNTTLYWNTNPRISESDFIFTIPKGTTKISIESAN